MRDQSLQIDQTKLLSVRDAAEVLAISKSTVRRLIAAGVLEPVRIGHQLRLRPADVARLADGGDTK